MATEVGRVVTYFGADPSEFNRATKGMQNQTDGFKKKIKALQVAAGLSFAALGAAAVKASDTMTLALRKLAVGTGQTDQALKRLEISFKQVFVGVSQSADEVASTISELNTILGVQDIQLSKLAKGLLDVSRLMGESVLPVTESFSRAMVQFGISGRRGVEVLDTFFSVSQRTGTNLTKLTTIVKDFGSVMTTAGFTIEETAGFFGLLEKAGIAITRIGPGLKAFFANTASAGKDVRSELTDLIRALQDATTETGALVLAEEALGREGATRFVRAVRSRAVSLEKLDELLKNTKDSIEKANEGSKTFGEGLLELRNILTGMTPSFNAFGDLLDRINKGLRRVFGQDSDFMKGAALTSQRVTQLTRQLSKLSGISEKKIKAATGIEELGSLVKDMPIAIKALALELVKARMAAKLASELLPDFKENLEGVGKGAGGATRDVKKLDGALEELKQEMAELNAEFAAADIEEALQANERLQRLMEEARDVRKRDADEKKREMEDEKKGLKELATVSLDVGKEISRAMTDAFEGVILGTRKLSDVMEGLFHGLVRSAAEFFVDIIKEKWAFEIKLIANVRSLGPKLAGAASAGVASAPGTAAASGGGLISGLGGILTGVTTPLGSALLGGAVGGATGGGGIGSLAGGAIGGLLGNVGGQALAGALGLGGGLIGSGFGLAGSLLGSFAGGQLGGNLSTGQTVGGIIGGGLGFVGGSALGATLGLGAATAAGGSAIGGFATGAAIGGPIGLIAGGILGGLVGGGLFGGGKSIKDMYKRREASFRTGQAANLAAGFDAGGTFGPTEQEVAFLLQAAQTQAATDEFHRRISEFSPGALALRAQQLRAKGGGALPGLVPVEAELRRRGLPESSGLTAGSLQGLIKKQEAERVRVEVENTTAAFKEAVKQLEFQKSLLGKSAEEITKIVREAELAELAAAGFSSSQVDTLRTLAKQRDEMGLQLQKQQEQIALDEQRRAEIERITEAFESNLEGLQFQKSLIGKSADEASRLTTEFELSQLAAQGFTKEQISSLRNITLEVRQMEKILALEEQRRIEAEERRRIDEARLALFEGTTERLTREIALVGKTGLEGATIQKGFTLADFATSGFSQRQLDVVGGLIQERNELRFPPEAAAAGPPEAAAAGGGNISITINGNVTGEEDVRDLARRIERILSGQIAPL